LCPACDRSMQRTTGRRRLKTQNVAIVSIHPDPAAPLAIEVKDILAALAPHLPHWIWCVRKLDWLGENADAVCQMVEAAPNGLWMTSQELLAHTRKIYQTIDGEFLAFPRKIEPNEVAPDEIGLAGFPESRAELAIVAVDGSYFEVYAKDAGIAASLRALKNVREENSDRYF
jgi:hypothetical protein